MYTYFVAVGLPQGRRHCLVIIKPRYPCHFFADSCTEVTLGNRAWHLRAATLHRHDTNRRIARTSRTNMSLTKWHTQKINAFMRPTGWQMICFTRKPTPLKRFSGYRSIIINFALHDWKANPVLCTLSLGLLATSRKSTLKTLLNPHYREKRTKHNYWMFDQLKNGMLRKGVNLKP